MDTSPQVKNSEISQIIARQRDFFKNHPTYDYKFRLEHLKLLKATLQRHENDLLDALTADLGKSHFEGYATELGLVLEELGGVIKNLKKWMRPQKVATPLVHFPAQSWIYPEPLGIVLIISPWNYPLQLTFMPLIGAIAAGNCAAIKPSRYSQHTSDIMEKVIREVFTPEYVSFFHGGTEMNTALLEQRFDHIFFTGSPTVGRVVMAAASKNLTPVTLELGGKSPCIIDKSADLDLAAARVVWGKCINAGQTCVGIDYLLVHKDVLKPFMAAVREKLLKFFGEKPLLNPEYPKIINQRQFERLLGLMNGLHAEIGGSVDAEHLKIEPSFFVDVSLDDAIMKEEIFGPLMPVFTWEHIEDALAIIGGFEKPLALYLFTTDIALEEQIIQHVPFGGGCINDALVHLSNSSLPFGGVGESGLGSYHGKKSFETLTHYKSIIKKSAHIEIPLRLPPFADHLNIIRLLIK